MDQLPHIRQLVTQVTRHLPVVGGVAVAIAWGLRGAARGAGVARRLTLVALAPFTPWLPILSKGLRFISFGRSLMLTALRALAGRVPWPRLPHWSKEAELAILAGSLSFGLIAGGAFAARSIGADRPASIAAASLVEPTATPAPTVTPTPELKPIEQVPIRTRSLPKLVIPQIRVDASMHPVGLTQSGAMDIPLDGERIAWYSLGPFPGTPGNAVLAGHVDWQSRAAVFSRLRDLRPGMPLYLETERGAQLQYAVSWVEQYRAQAAPLNRVFENSIGSTLTLITCGGTFDSRSRTYPDRLVVRAVRV